MHRAAGHRGLALGTSAGLLSFSHPGTAQMLQKVTSSVLQLQRAMPPELTVPDAAVAMTSNGGAGALFCDVMLLGREAA